MATNDDKITRQIKKRHSDIPQDPLFNIPDQAQSSPEPTSKTAKPKTVGSMPCDECMNKRVGIIRVWREIEYIYIMRDHDRITRKGHRFPCPASGRQVDEPG